MRFYGVNYYDFKTLPYRQFTALLKGLVSYEDSAFRRAIEAEEENNGSWRPPPDPKSIAPTVEEGQNVLKRAFGI